MYILLKRNKINVQSTQNKAKIDKWVFVPEISANTYASIFDKLRRLKNVNRVIKVKDRPWVDGHKHIITPQDDLIGTFQVFLEKIEPGKVSHKHGHQNPAVFYILEGKGYEIHDNKRCDWEAGDVVVVPPGCVHQHLNSDTEKPAIALVMNPKPVFMLMHLFAQKTIKGPKSEGGQGDVQP